MTGETIEWEERKMDFKPVSDKYDQRTTFFEKASDLKWVNIDYIPGNHKIWYAVLEGGVPMGMCKIQPGGYFKLHWHNETEHYLIISGQGRFTIGTEERDIDAEKDPALITIPANVPHQTYNPGDTDLIWFYFFPETKTCESMRYFYPCGKVYQRWPENKDDERRLSQDSLNLI